MSSGRRGTMILGAMSSEIKCDSCGKMFSVAQAAKIYDAVGKETKDPKDAKCFECPHCNEITTI